jgi:hypothetical protein
MPSLDQERQGWRGLFRRDAKMGKPRVGFLTQLHSYDYRRKEFFNERVGIRRPFLPTGLCTELVTAKKIPAQALT